MERNKQLVQRMTSVTGGVGYAGIPEDQKLNEKCAARAYKVAEERYVVV